jgi:maleate isomerase
LKSGPFSRRDPLPNMELGRPRSTEADDMQRRRFITLGAAAAIATPLLRSAPSKAAQRPDWQPDGVGAVARIGVLTPDFDPVPETETAAMAPRGVSVHAARVPRQPGGARAFAEPPGVDAAVDQLVGLAARAILFAYTSSSYALGAAGEESVRARLAARAQTIPVLLTCPAAADALRLLGVRRLALVHPPWFSEETNTQGREYFASQGFDVLRSTRLGPPRSFTEVPPAEVYEWTRANVPSDAEGVFIGGNGLRAVGAIQALEQALRRPVLTANQVLFWQAARIVGVAGQVTQYGRIFRSAASR